MLVSSSAQPAMVLVVDDVAANRMMLERHLIRLGHRVLFAEHGREAMDLLQAQQVDLILLDIMMPVMNGFETLAALKADPAVQHLPVVIVSALDDNASIARCVSLGADDFLFKPVERVLLEARVAASLARKRLYDREQAAYAAAEAANRAKGAFVSMVSHELKNPVAGLTGYADILLLETAGPLNSMQSECVRAIRNLSSLMTNLIADLTDLSKIESGHLHLTLAPISLSATMEAAIIGVQKQIDDRQHQLVFNLPDNLPLVMADHMRLVQILSNLLSNAVKYTPPQGVITLSALSSDGGMVEVAVRDNGKGISAHDQELIFSPFFRTSEAYAGDQPGTGLGLSITRHLVELQGGRIWFTSVPAAGTTFFFTLPVADGPAALVAPPIPTRASLRW
jgi:signal transduction histidine kinase